ncbi:MAG TPA: putative toxin-antitoxin system toxin component, PIN family [Candidatus Kapabacteria bacterium]|nr:putative toxin-antitoxin system toxin component, PIN family [Candidatus Kapabacteria bacterium]
MRIFFDTNVLASALAYPNGLCSKLLREAFDNHEVEISEYVLGELKDVLVRKLYRSEQEVKSWIDELREYASILPIVPPITIPLRDPDDIPILSTAVQCESEILVSGDKDLLELIDPPIHIMSPRALHDLIVPR